MPRPQETVSKQQDGAMSAIHVARLMTAPALSVVVLLCAGHARAQEDALYERSRILEHTGMECSGADNCMSVRGGRYRIAAGHTEQITVQCPEKRPYFVSWDSEQTENITATVQSRPNIPVSAAGGASGPDSRLLIVAHNEAQAGGGHITLFLGCATQATAPVTGIMRSRAGVPSNAPSFSGSN
jgi:hypothetical protein